MMNAIIFVYDSVLKEKWEKKGKEIKNKERHHLCIIVLNSGYFWNDEIMGCFLFLWLTRIFKNLRLRLYNDFICKSLFLIHPKWTAYIAWVLFLNTAIGAYVCECTWRVSGRIRSDWLLAVVSPGEHTWSRRGGCYLRFCFINFQVVCIGLIC